MGEIEYVGSYDSALSYVYRERPNVRVPPTALTLNISMVSARATCALSVMNSTARR